MTVYKPGLLTRAQRLAQTLSLGLIALVAGGLIVASLAAAFGLLPWLEFTARFGATELPQAGMITQLAVTALFTGLLFFLPANARMMRLETSHRDFTVRMEDVTRAYRAVHADERKGLFRIGSEFDSVRERIARLRDHPDLGALEPEVLELAAQMSFESRELAQVYSDAKVARARTFLRQRQEEMEQFEDNLTLAKRAVDELKHWRMQLDGDEAAARGQLRALERDLMDLLPQLGYELATDTRREDRSDPDHMVVAMPAKRGARATDGKDVH